jgi:hypothetical protein
MRWKLENNQVNSNRAESEIRAFEMLNKNQTKSKRPAAKRVTVKTRAKPRTPIPPQAPENVLTMKTTDPTETQGHNLGKRILTVAEVNAAVGVQSWGAHTFGGEVHMMTLLERIEAQTAAVQAGELGDVEAMLFGQALTLQAIFTTFARKGAQNLATNTAGMDLCLRLAFKAQSQCRSTLETLAEIKNPRTATFIKQANVAGGHQQVNNGTTPNEPRPDEKTADQPNELLTDERAKHAKPMDTGTTGKAVKRNSRMEAMGKGHRAAHAVE